MCPNSHQLLAVLCNPRECEELAYELLAALPRSRLASIQRRIAPLLRFDILGALPAELALHVIAFLSYRSILTCTLVCRRWKALTDDQTLWKRLCRIRGWEWRVPLPVARYPSEQISNTWDDGDDEGMGDSDQEDFSLGRVSDSGFVSLVAGDPSSSSISTSGAHSRNPWRIYQRPSSFIGAPGTNASPNYRLLFLTNLLFYVRFLRSSYRLSHLQTRESPQPGHHNMIYCLQLYTYPSSGRQSLFTGSRDQTVREWDLETREVFRVIGGIHTSSVLSICAHNGFLASAGSDGRVVVWDLDRDRLVKVMSDHEDSVLCVRFDSERMVTCSKDRTVRTYSFPDLVPQFVLGQHRAAVNAVSIYKNLIVSGSGDRSVKLWDADTGKLLRSFDDHHSRGIASIDFKPPYILSGSSDKHLRLFDMTTLQGWSTTREGTLLETAHPTIEPHALIGGSTDPEDSPSNAPYPLDSQFLSGVFGAGDEEDDLDLVSERPCPCPCPCSCLCARPSSRTRPGNESTITMVCRECGCNDICVLHAHHVSGGLGNAANGRSFFHASADHKDLVRSVALGERFVVSGSYDRTIKVWDRRSGALVADLTGGHTGRIFCIAFDRAKIVSCGEDHRICVWDFGHGIDTSFVRLS
ncbi:hypothetical protein APHAL10511_000902 [Amanita phalloides]|nr:hypothetical protein APHAL10511_000902 [Amanita phalloides]